MGAATAVARPSAALLWTGMLLPPIAWAMDLVVRYALVKWTCGTRSTAPLQLITFGTLTLICIAALAAWRALRATPRSAPTDGGHPVERARFMAMLGLVTAALFGLATIGGAIPQWVLDACL